MVAITIRDVPPETRDELAARAARSGRSLQEFLRGQLVDLAARPDREAWLAELEASVARDGARVPVEAIVEAVDSDLR